MTWKIDPANVIIDGNGCAWRPFLMENIEVFKMNLNLAMDESKVEELKKHLGDCRLKVEKAIDGNIKPENFTNCLRKRKIEQSDLV